MLPGDAADDVVGTEQLREYHQLAEADVRQL